MSITINEVLIDGGPLPQGPLNVYSYDPVTSIVYLTKLTNNTLELPASVTVNAVLKSPDLNDISDSTTLIVDVYNEFPDTPSVGETAYAVVNFTGQINLSIHECSSGLRLAVESYYTYPYDGSSHRVVKGVCTIDNITPGPLTLPINFTTYTVATATGQVQSYNGGITGTTTPTNGTVTLTVTRMADDPEHVNKFISVAYLECLVKPGIAAEESDYVKFINTFDQLGYTSDWVVEAITPVSVLVISAANIINTSWGYVTDGQKMLAVHTLAPFPPPFFDPTWCNPVDYIDDTTSQVLPLIREQIFASSISRLSIPNLNKVVKLLDDIHAKPTPTVYSVALITQESATRQLLWRCIYEPYVTNPGNRNWRVGRWTPSEKVYKYKAGSIYFGGKDYAGPLNSILVDAQNGTVGAEYRILDLNEFRVNTDNEVEVDAYTCNYSSSNPIVYCVLNKSTGRMAEITAATHAVRYFTVVVPVDCVIHQLYYTTRLMYTVYNTANGTFSLYDAHNNGILLHTFTLGTYDPAIIPQFSIIN